jgi:hypothetical protein
MQGFVSAMPLPTANDSCFLSQEDKYPQLLHSFLNPLVFQHLSRPNTMPKIKTRIPSARTRGRKLNTRQRESLAPKARQRRTAGSNDRERSTTTNKANGQFNTPDAGNTQGPDDPAAAGANEDMVIDEVNNPGAADEPTPDLAKPKTKKAAVNEGARSTGDKVEVRFHL